MSSRISIAIVGVIVVVVGLYVWSAADAPMTIGREMEMAFEAGDMEEVLRLAKSQQVLPNDTMFYWRAGLAAEAEEDLALAIGYLNQAVACSTNEELTSSVLLTKARVQEDLFRFHGALATLTSIPLAAGDNAAAGNKAAAGNNAAQGGAVVHRRLAEVLDRMGRRYEANSHHLALVKSGEHQVEDLIWLANRQDPVVDETLENILNGSTTAEDAYRLSRALVYFRSGELLEAEQLLRIEIREYPKQVEAYAILGLVMTDFGKFEQLRQWQSALPKAAVDHPDIWFTLGSWAETQQQQDLAVRYYHQAVSLDVSLQPAIFRLLQLLDGQQIERSLRTRLTRYQADLLRYQQLCKRIFFEGPAAELVDEAIGLSQDLFRFHEAIGWCAIKQSTLSGSGVGGSRRLIHRLTEAIDQNQAEVNHPVRKLLQQVESDERWAKAFSTPLDQLSVKTTSAVDSTEANKVTASFDDQANQFGITFAFDKGTDSKSGLMIQQSMGGGVAVVDLDQDGWPDLFFPQGVSPLKTDSDTLFRNRMAQGFDRVEELAGCVDAVYSHGAAVGDVNNDGFPDLMVANQGGNHLYVNNGDGTFDNASSLLDSSAWTISGMIADLNGDSFPDLFEANYLAGELPFTKVCIDQKLQLPRTCPPEQFEGQANQCYLNDVEGGFQKVSLEGGLDQFTGKSLGLVAADFEGTGALGVFVANDQVANEFLQINDSASKLSVVFRDAAVLKGIAYNGTGEALACMGVASADVNHDGYLDLFVTNFYRQENTLYTNLAGAGFRDSTAQAKLRAPSLAQLGFGTQFLDANLDSEPDIVVANGHLDDFTDRNIPYAMHSQVLMNTGDSQFVVQSYAASGPWFQQTHLARGIAKLDWNRDGREDIAVSQLSERVALLTNTTAAAGHFVCFKLIGQHSSRDAVGTKVKIDFADSTRWMQVTAGDGYASSNQRQLTFGLGKETAVDSITVTWPSGERQSFEHVEADQCYLVVEQFDRLMVNPR